MSFMKRVFFIAVRNGQIYMVQKVANNWSTNCIFDLRNLTTSFDYASKVSVFSRSHALYRRENTNVLKQFLSTFISHYEEFKS